MVSQQREGLLRGAERWAQRPFQREEACLISWREPIDEALECALDARDEAVRYTRAGEPISELPTSIAGSAKEDSAG
jgi:hypothetical protein